MRKSQRNDSKFGRFLYYKHSGIIVFAPIIIFAVALYIYNDDQQEFFSAWSCDTIENYLLDIEVPDSIPQHNDITDEQHMKLHIINDECVATTQFSINEHK